MSAQSISKIINQEKEVQRTRYIIKESEEVILKLIVAVKKGLQIQ